MQVDPGPAWLIGVCSARMEKPLHVQVAEALGVVPCTLWSLWGTGLSGPEYIKSTPCQHECYPVGFPPRYDLHWATTGPLIERYQMLVFPTHPGTEPFESWSAQESVSPSRGLFVGARGSTPLIAVCRLLLALKAAGKLAA